MSHQSIRDLRFWAGLRPGQEFGRLLWHPPTSATLYTDASGAGWGGGLTVDGVKYEARGFFGPGDATKHINAKEILAVTLSLLSFEDKLRVGAVVRLFVDSQVALAVIAALSSRSPALVRELRRLHAVARRLSVALDGQWIPTAENAWADALSRDEDRTDWCLGRRFFLSLDAAYGPHTVDRFASATTSHLARYNSRRRDPSTEAVDALSQSWSGDNNWANPPFSLVPLVLRLIAAQRATATVIVPVWRAQPWWRPALQQADEVLYLPRAAGVFRHGAAAAPRRRPHWTVCALRFTDGGRRPGRRHGRGPASSSATTVLAPAPAVRLPRSC